MRNRSWMGVPLRMPRLLPPPFPELAFLLRFVLERICLPPSSQRDFVINYLRHVSIVRRLPAKRLMFNDVLFHIKTSRILQRPLAIAVTDKELAKHHIAKVVGENYVIPTLAILTTPEEIDSFVFPDRCIIKPTHASGEYIARMSGEPLDVGRIRNWLKLNYYTVNYEANYRTLVPKVIVEPWVFDTAEIREFKLFCVAGKVRTIDALSDRFTSYSAASFDASWNEASYNNIYKDAVYRPFEKPMHLEEIISVAERLAKDFFFVRVDLYYDGTTIKCGEITNCSAAGLEIYKPRSDEHVHSCLLFSEVPEEVWNDFFRDQQLLTEMNFWTNSISGERSISG